MQLGIFDMAKALSSDTFDRVTEIRFALLRRADDENALQMAAYMKDHFAFFGIKAPDRRLAQKPLIESLSEATGDELIEFASACWTEEQREIQYVAADALRKYVGALQARHLVDLKDLIATKSWWDTVDSLAVHTVGPLVAANGDLVLVMDEWIDDDNMWLARTAILHQLSYKERTDADRLFAYVDKRASDTEFFIRKALGWAMRQYSRTDPGAVRDYVAANEDRLSGLTKREALKRL